NGEDELLALVQFGDPVLRERALSFLFALPWCEAKIRLAFLLRGPDAMKDRHGDDFIPGLEADTANAGRRSRLELADVGGLEANCLTVSRGEQNVVAFS